MAGKFVVALALLASASAFVPSAFHGQTSVQHVTRVNRPTALQMASDKELRTRIDSVSNTRKITEAMRLVAAAKVRRAQQAVLATRPFSETLQSVFSGLISRLGSESVELPLLEAREVGKVTLVSITGDRGLCGSYNAYGIKKTEARIKELKAQGIDVELVCIGKKTCGYFSKRETPVVATYDCGQAPKAEDATAISESLLASYLAGETDSVEVIYTKFVSLIASSPAIRTMLPLSPRGIESEGDELFQLTTKDGQFSVEKDERDAVAPAEFPSDMIFEQDPLQILNAILPLYINGQVLRMLQESVASELAARMQAMQSASDNANQLKKDLTQEYNRIRQASVTQEILEIVSGATAASG